MNYSYKQVEFSRHSMFDSMSDKH